MEQSFWRTKNRSASEETRRASAAGLQNYVRGCLIYSVHNFSLHTTTCISSLAPSRRRQTTVRFIGHSRIVHPQYEKCSLSPKNLEAPPALLENLSTLAIPYSQDPTIWAYPEPAEPRSHPISLRYIST